MLDFYFYLLWKQNIEKCSKQKRVQGAEKTLLVSIGVIKQYFHVEYL